eukprot:10480909-Alexandrium_andersonii.AAC.1
MLSRARLHGPTDNLQLVSPARFESVGVAPPPRRAALCNGVVPTEEDWLQGIHTNCAPLSHLRV